MAANPSRESYDVQTGNREVVYIAGRDAQDWSLNEAQRIQLGMFRRMGNILFKEGAILKGCGVNFPAGGQIEVASGMVWMQDADGNPAPVRLRLGLSDDQFTEVLGGTLSEGMHVITAARIRRD